MGEHLQGFSQAHFVGEDTAKGVGAKEGQPGDPVFLIRSKHGFQRAKWRTLELKFPALPARAILPGRGCLERETLIPQRTVEKSRLLGVHSVTDSGVARTLRGRAILEYFLKLRHGLGVEDCKLPTLQFATAAPAQELLDFAGGKAFASGGSVAHLQVEPLFSAGGDPELGRDPFQILLGAAFQPFFQRDRPFLFQAGVFPGKEGHDAFLADQLPLTLGVGTGEASAAQSLESPVFGGQIASGIPPNLDRIGQPRGFTGGRDSHGHDSRPVGALQLTRQLGESTGKVEQELRRGGREFEVFDPEVRFDRGRVELRPILEEELRNLGAGQSLRSLDDASNGWRESDGLECGSGPQPGGGLGSQQRGWAAAGFQSEHDFAVVPELGLEGQGGGLQRNGEGLLTSDGDPGMSGEGGQELQKISGRELTHPRGVAAG